MSLTIRYRHPQRPDEAGMAVVADQAKAEAMRGELEDRGFLVVEIVPASFPKAAPSI